MKKFYLSFIFLLAISAGYAQVDNYSLELPASGYVNVGVLPELDNAAEYTLQLWMKPTAWGAGSALLARGTGAERFGLFLGNAVGDLTFSVGNRVVSFSSSEIALNKWAHISLLYATGQLKVLVNNQLVHAESISLSIPASVEPLYLGENFTGNIDEFRMWRTLVSDNFLLWRNTIHKHHPNWDSLVVYYKFDQNLCPDVVDYTFTHHGTFQAGASRSLVTDNSAFVYRLHAAYTDFARFADRGVDKEKYLLANDVVMLGIESDTEGNITIPFADNQGEITKGSQLNTFDGRSGVLSLHGQGARMEVGSNVLKLDETEQYTFQTWLHIDSWQTGAYLFRKEANDNNGFSIRFGNTDTLIVRLNGAEYIKRLPLALRGDKALNAWWHFAVATMSTNELDDRNLFIFFFNGTASYASKAPATRPTTFVPAGVDGVVGVIGEDFNGKLDDTAIWRARLSVNQVSNYMNNPLPMPGFGVIVDAASVFYKKDSYWNYNNAANVGYDSYSYRHFMGIVRSAFEGYRGYTLRMSVKSHDGWQTTMADATKRQKMIDGIVEAAKDFDGIDLDFEWCYDAACFNHYGTLIHEVGKRLDPQKVFTVTPHYIAYEIPLPFHEHVDYFYFQIYGPNPRVFTWDTHVDAHKRFKDYGYDNKKIIMSYATSTSRAVDTPDIDGVQSGNPIGVANGLLDGSYTPDMDIVVDSNGKYRFITGVNQSRNRAEFCHDHDLGGIMYWDMGNDVHTNHQYSLAKHASYAISSNVDTIVTTVTPNPSALRPVVSTHKQQLLLYPNPVTTGIQFVLGSDVSVESVRIFNTSGQLVQTATNLLFERAVSVAQLPVGHYTLQLKTKNGELRTASFVKK